MEFPIDKKIILFDGVCNLCNSTVNYIIKKDTKDVFRFASLQSELAKDYMRERSIDLEKTDSIIYIEPDIAYYTKSSAAIEIAKELGGMWSLLGIFNHILPQQIRDAVYDLIARNRYKWFGKKEQCMIPTPELKARFLDI